MPLRHRVADVQTGESFTLARCPECGLGITIDVPDDLAPHYGEQYVGGRHGFTAAMCDRRRIQIIDRVGTPPGKMDSVKLLDFGCGDGTFLAAAIRKGYRAIGVERFSSVAVDAGLPVKSSLEQASSEGPFDIVTMWHTLEHLTDPLEVVQRIGETMTDRGVLVIAVPDSGSLPARVFGRFWLHWDVPRHKYHFTSRSLKKLLTMRGFDVEWYRGSEFEYDLMGWASSGVDVAAAEPNLFFKRLTGRPTKTGFAGRTLSLIFGTILSLILAVPVGIAGQFGRGGTLIMIACPASSRLRFESETLERRIV